MIESLIWLLVIEVIGLAALPLAFSFFKYLPERGYSLAKPLGLLLVGFVVWFLGMFGLPFTALTSWLLTAVVLGGSGIWLLLREKRELLNEIRDWFDEHRGLVVALEIAFILAYYYLVNLRSYMPEIRDQEKFGDYAFMNSMALHSKLPPTDPWMSGYTINYYYFSHFLMAMLTKMSAVSPPIAFNLTVPLVGGFVFSGAFGLVYNLVALARRRGGLAPALTGLLAGIFICFIGNLSALRQIISPRLSEGERDPNSATFYFSWWSPSRVIWDYMPVPQGNTVVYQWNQTINEFPMFSFLLADMHPHVMALPFVMILIMTALNLLLTPASAGPLTLRTPLGIFNFVVLAITAGSLYFLNTWDFPTFLILVIGAALVRELWKGGAEIEEEISKDRPLVAALKIGLLGGNIPAGPLSPGFARAWRFFGFAVRLGLVSYLLYTPFHLTFTSLVGDRPLPDPLNKIPLISTIGKLFGAVAWNRTPLFGYVLVFGVFILPILSFLLLKLWPYLRNPYGYLEDGVIEEEEPGVGAVPRLPIASYYILLAGLAIFMVAEGLYFTGISLEFSLAIGLASIPVLAAGFARVAHDYLEQIRPLHYGYELSLTFCGSVVVLVLLGWAMRFELYGPLIFTIVTSGLLLFFETRQKANKLNLADAFGLLLIFLPATINWFTEIIYLRDVFESRFNTIFKFYYQSWLMFGLAAAYSSWRVIALLWQLKPFEPEMPDETKFASRYLPMSPPEPGDPAQPAAAMAVMVLPTEEELEEMAEVEVRRQPTWRWAWLFALVLIILAGLIYPVLGPYEKSGKFANRQGLDGEAWVGAQGAYTADYAAIKWLRQQAAANPDFEGTILEAAGYDWINYSRVATFSGYPTVLGWFSHEQQWRGGSPKLLDEVGNRFRDIDRIYNTTDVNEARALLQKYNVKYVFVGQIETNTTSASLYSQSFKNYAPEGLAKFRQFMKPVYDSNGVTIYSF